MSRWAALLVMLSLWIGVPAAGAEPTIQEYSVPAGSHPHDVAPAADGGIWFTAQAAGYLGWLDPNSGQIRQIPLGAHSAPHGVIVGPDAAAWVTDGGQNAIVRVDSQTSDVRLFPLPGRNANLNTAAFDDQGILWFTGQNGVYGRLDPQTAELRVFDAPRGAGPYGVTASADGSRVFYASLAGSHIAEINRETSSAAPIDPPTAGQGARRVWTDSHGSIWVSEWKPGHVARVDPRTGDWREWKLPGPRPTAYAVWVDPRDVVWLSDWSSNAIVSFDPATGAFQQFPMPRNGAEIRELQGRAGEVWGAESAQDRIVVIRQ